MIKHFLLTISFLCICLVTLTASAGASNLLGGVDCGAAAQSAVCSKQDNGNSNPVAGPNGLLLKITNIIAYAGGVAAVIVIIVSAIRFITSGSDTSKGGRVDDDVVNARRSIIGALIGLAVIVLAKTLITFFVNKL